MVAAGLLRMMWFCRGTNQTTHARHVYPSIEFLHSFREELLIEMCSSPINLLWTRLVRYSSSADGPIKYGEPVSSPNADLGQLASKGELQATMRSVWK